MAACSVVGCAVSPPSIPAVPLRVALAQVAPPDREALDRVVNLERGADTPRDEGALDAAILGLRSEAQRLMAAALAGLSGVTVVEASPPLPESLGRPPIARPDEQLDAREAERLRRLTGADALVRFGITDYGVTPKAWRSGIILFEVVSTLGIAAIAYARPATRPIAGIYLVQEGIEEFVSLSAGFWLVDEVLRPVRLEAELIDLSSGRRLWTDGRTGWSDLAWSRAWRTVPAEERRLQLQVALQEAVHALVSSLRRQRGATD